MSVVHARWYAWMLLLAASAAQAAHFSKMAGKFDCPDIGNSLNCARAIERSLHVPFIHHDDGRLDIDLLNGRVYSLADVESEDHRARYYNVMELSADRRYVVVHCQFVEGDQFGLLDRKTGMYTTLNGYPVFSPDGRWLAVADGGENDTGVLQIFAVANGSLNLAFSADPGKWWPEQVRWQSSRQLDYERATLTDPHGVTVGTVKAAALWDGGRWKVH